MTDQYPCDLGLDQRSVTAERIEDHSKAVALIYFRAKPHNHLAETGAPSANPRAGPRDPLGPDGSLNLVRDHSERLHHTQHSRDANFDRFQVEPTRFAGLVDQDGLAQVERCRPERTITQRECKSRGAPNSRAKRSVAS